jgi:ribonuclease HI
MQFCTVNTDASVNTHSGRAGYAYWITGEDIGGKILRIVETEAGYQKDVNLAEVEAIHRALQRIPGSGMVFDMLVVNSDSRIALTLLSHDTKPTRFKSELWEAVGDTRELLGSFGVPVKFKHVRAHSTNTDTRSWVNQWCDRESRQARKRFEDSETRAVKMQMIAGE